MAWYNEKFECPNPPDCAANQMVPPSEWNAMVAYLKDKIRGMPFTVPGAGDDGKYIKYVHSTPGFVLDTPAGGGDMLKSVYDIGDNGIVDNSEKVDGCDAGIATGNVFKIPAGITQGDIFYVNASGNIVRLAAGTNGHFLKTQGAAANPIWAAGAGGVNTWLELTDTPSAFTGQAGKLPKVNAGATALEFGMLESDIFKKDGSVAMTWDIDMAASDVKNCFRVIANLDNQFLTLYGGATLASNSYIRLYGNNSSPNYGKITFELLNAAKTGRVMAGYFQGATDTPKLRLEHGLIVDVIAEKTAAAGVTIDTCLIKDGKAANSDKVGGKQLADLLEVAAGDFNAFTEKVSPVNADIVLIEDSAASYAKKKVQIGNLPGGGGSSTWLGLTDTPGAFDNGKIVKSGAAALSFGMLESDIFKKDGSVAMTWDIDMAASDVKNCFRVIANLDNQFLTLYGGATLASNSYIRLYGKDATGNLGKLTFEILNAAKTGQVMGGYFSGATDTPKLTLNHGLITDTIEEKTVAAGVTVDTCLIKDGKAADSDKVDACHAGVATGNVFKIPASIAQGDIFYVDASGHIVKLAAGTNGHFLMTQGAAANPIWAAGESNEEWFYKLLCALTDPSLILVDDDGDLTTSEDIFVRIADDFYFGDTVKPVINMPIYPLSPFVMQPLRVESGVRIQTKYDTPIMYITVASINNISYDAKKRFYRRYKYCLETTPTKYLVTHTAVNQGIYTSISVTGNAILGFINARMINRIGPCIDVSGNKLLGIFTPNPGETAAIKDYHFFSAFPMLPLLGTKTNTILSTSATEYYEANSNFAYYEVYDNIPAWW